MDKNSSLSSVLASDVDVSKRRIYFGSIDANDASDGNGSDFGWRSVEKVVRIIHKLEGEAANKPIELHMHSVGGDALSMLRLHDTIMSCSCQIKFFGGGEICSAATFIMAACDERYLYPHTRIMLHELGEDPGFRKMTDQHVGCAENAFLQERMCEIYANNSIMGIDFWRTLIRRDLWINAQEAIMLGLADKIVPYKKRGTLRKVRIAMMKAKRDPQVMSDLANTLKRRVYADGVNAFEISVPKEQFDKSLSVDATPISEQEVPSGETAQAVNGSNSGSSEA